MHRRQLQRACLGVLAVAACQAPAVAPDTNPSTPRPTPPTHSVAVADGRVERWTCSGDTPAVIDPTTDRFPPAPDKPPQPVPLRSP